MVPDGLLATSWQPPWRAGMPGSSGNGRFPRFWSPVAIAVYNVREGRRLAALAAVRPGESICSFARALPVRDLDTWVVRATFEQLQAHLPGLHAAFPVRPSDRLVADLGIDPDDLEDIAFQVATRAGRSMDGGPANPYYNKVTTVEDLINFLCAQPNGTTREVLR